MPPSALPRKIAPLSGVLADEIRAAVQTLVVDAADPIDVAAQLRKGREHLADAVDHLPPPIAFDDQSI